MTDTDTAPAPEAPPIIDRPTVPQRLQDAVHTLFAEIEAHCTPGVVVKELDFAKARLHESYERLENHFVRKEIAIEAGDVTEPAAETAA